MDREALLRAIKAHPNENTPRLMYADWLEEFGEGDRDAATVDFIRLSCGVAGAKKGDPMPRAVYPWLAHNWKRLVPTLANSPANGGSFYSGRKREFRLKVEDLKHRLGFRAYNTVLDFHRGFLVACQTWSVVSFAKMKELLTSDQPLCEVR